MGRGFGATCIPNKVGSSECALHEASEDLVRVELGHTVRSVGRRPHASLQRSVRTTFVLTDLNHQLDTYRYCITLHAEGG